VPRDVCRKTGFPPRFSLLIVPFDGLQFGARHLLRTPKIVFAALLCPGPRLRGDRDKERLLTNFSESPWMIWLVILCPSTPPDIIVTHED
jgi:hypothetical protein